MMTRLAIMVNPTARPAGDLFDTPLHEKRLRADRRRADDGLSRNLELNPFLSQRTDLTITPTLRHGYGDIDLDQLLVLRRDISIDRQTARLHCPSVLVLILPPSISSILLNLPSRHTRHTHLFRIRHGLPTL